MSFPSTLFLCSPPNVNPQFPFQAQPPKRGHRRDFFGRVPLGLFPAKELSFNRGRLKRLLVLRPASSSSSSSKGDVGPGRRVYTETQGQDPLPLHLVRVKEFAAFAVPAGAFLAVTLGRELEKKYRHLFWTPCAAHCLDLMLEDIFKLPKFKTTWERAMKVHSYIYTRPSLLNLMRKFTNKRELVKPAKTRFATAFLTLQRVYEQKKNLRKMFTSEEWNRSKWAKETLGKQIVRIMFSATFWREVVLSLRFAYPLVKVLRLVDGEVKPAMGYIYEAMDRAKEAIAKSLNMDSTKYQEVYDIIDKRWDIQLHQPLHAAGFYLNPEFFYKDPQAAKTTEIQGGLYNCLMKMVPNVKEQDNIMADLTKYEKAEGLFGHPLAIRHKDRKAPVLWKLSEKFLLPRTSTDSSVASKAMEGIKLSFTPGTNVLQGFGAKAGGEVRKRLNHFAKELRSSSRVDISGCNFGNDGLFFLAEILAYNKVAEEVNFAANGISAAGLQAFDGVLQSNMFLKALDLSVNPIGDEGAKCLCDILVGNSGIQKLQLNSVDLGDEGAKAIGEMLKKNSSLRVLELNNNMIDYSGFTSLAGALLENDNIQSLYLNGNYCGTLGAASLAKGLEGNKSLREISLQGNSIGDEGVRVLMSSLSLREGILQHLDIGNNVITSKGAFHVAEYVRESKSLVFLNLSMNDIGDEGAEKIAEALKQNQSLANLDLAGNNIHAKGASAIAQALKDNSTITKLEISYNQIGPHGAKALFEVLKAYGNIKTLSLGWCQIGAMGVEFIADALKYNSTISTLDLRANGVGDEGAICLSQSLKVVNGALTSLDLGFNEIGDDGAFAIARALKANEDVSITKLNLANNSISKLGQGVLTDAVDHVYEMTEKEVNIFF